MKDWQGNGTSIFKNLGASNHVDHDRADNDFYATDSSTIDSLLKVYPQLPTDIWECACGQGHLAKRLEEHGYNVVATDLIDRGFGLGGVDFLKTTEMPKDCTCILTNPPFRYATEFVLHALDLLPQGGVCVMFLKTLFLEGKGRYKQLYSKQPPKYVFQFSERQKCALNGVFDDKRSAVSYAWYVWEKGYQGDTIVKWI